MLKDLLTRLGLSQEEVTTLLTNSMDQKGNTDPKAILAILQTAADRQDETMGQALKDLAAKLVVSDSTGDTTSDADRVRAQVIKILQQLESGDKNQTQDVKASLKAALASAENEAEESASSLGEKKSGPGVFQGHGTANPG